MSLRYWALGYWGLADANYLGEFTFATAPAASGNARKLATLTDSAFGPGVLVQSDGTRWRPMGEQVLSSGPSSDITLQSTAETATIVIGPFPGGLVKSGDLLSMNLFGRAPHSGYGWRYVFVKIGGTGTTGDPAVFIAQANADAPNQAAGGFSVLSMLRVASNTSAAHKTNYHGLYQLGETGVYGLGSWTPESTATIDFSAPWYLTLSATSGSETAVNITSSSWTGGVATHISTAHTLNTGDKTVIAGVSRAGYNNTFSPVTRIDANTFTVPLAADPGGAGTGGTTRRVSNIIIERYRLMWSS